MTTLDLLRAGRGRISRGHTRNVYTRSVGGYETYPWSPDACAWCAVGALRNSPNFGGEAYSAAYAALERAMGTGGALPTYSDTHSQADVLALYDRAIAAFAVAAPTPDGPRGCGS